MKGRTLSVNSESFELTLCQAKFIKSIRVEEGCSWRRVAEEFSKKYGFDETSNQLVGIKLCKEAIEILGESKDPDWN